MYDNISSIKNSSGDMKVFIRSYKPFYKIIYQ